MTTTRLSFPPATRKQAPAAPRAPDGLRSLAVAVGVPLASYYLLRKAGCDVVTSLAVSSTIGIAILVSVVGGIACLTELRVVAILDDNGTHWRPKESFRALAAAHGKAERTER
jgi:hypothetical protein